MPIFSCVTPTFFSLTRFVIKFVIPPEKKNQHSRQNNGHLTPKTSLSNGFGGQMPLFSWQIPLFFSLIRFVNEFVISPEKWINILG